MSGRSIRAHLIRGLIGRLAGYLFSSPGWVCGMPGRVIGTDECAFSSSWIRCRSASSCFCISPICSRNDSSWRAYSSVREVTLGGGSMPGSFQFSLLAARGEGGDGGMDRLPASAEGVRGGDGNGGNSLLIGGAEGAVPSGGGESSPGGSTLSSSCSRALSSGRSVPGRWRRGLGSVRGVDHCEPGGGGAVAGAGPTCSLLRPMRPPSQYVTSIS